MSMSEKLRLTKPHLRKVKGVWCVYFSDSPEAFANNWNWQAWEFAATLQGWNDAQAA